MKSSFYIKFRPSFFVLILLMIALRYLEQFFIAYIFMIIHEILHIALAREYGGCVKGITFMPVGLSADIQGLENIRLSRRILVLAIPPLFNIVFGILFRNNIVGRLNILIGLFNLMPVFPLDGSRLMVCVGGYIWGTLRANRYVANISLVICCTLILMGFLQMVLMNYNISLLLAAVYIIRESRRYEETTAYFIYKTLMTKKKRIYSCRRITAPYDMDIKTIVYSLGMDYYTVIEVRKDGIIGEITEDSLRKFIEKKGIDHNLVDILTNISYDNK